MSVPDISLLVPLAEQLNVTVAELLQGCRVEEEQRFTREETEELIRKALIFSAEPPERRQARTQKFLPLYGVSVVLGLVETAAVWAVGLPGNGFSWNRYRTHVSVAGVSISDLSDGRR